MLELAPYYSAFLGACGKSMYSFFVGSWTGDRRRHSTAGSFGAIISSIVATICLCCRLAALVGRCLSSSPRFAEQRGFIFNRFVASFGGRRSRFSFFCTP